MDKFSNLLANVNWRSIESIDQASAKVFSYLMNNKESLITHLKKLEDYPYLIELCEEYDFLTKISIYGDKKSKYRLRLHLFLPEYGNRPHYHRWSYSAWVISGSYQHFIYGKEDEFQAMINSSYLVPVEIRKEIKDATYTLNHDVVHSVIASPYTLTMNIRGPAVKNKFLVFDPRTNTSWWQYGSDQETIEEKYKKHISLDILQKRIETIIKILRNEELSHE